MSQNGGKKYNLYNTDFTKTVILAKVWKFTPTECIVEQEGGGRFLLWIYELLFTYFRV